MPYIRNSKFITKERERKKSAFIPVRTNSFLVMSYSSVSQILYLKKEEEEKKKKKAANMILSLPTVFKLLLQCWFFPQTKMLTS